MFFPSFGPAHYGVDIGEIYIIMCYPGKINKTTKTFLAAKKGKTSELCNNFLLFFYFLLSIVRKNTCRSRAAVAEPRHGATLPLPSSRGNGASNRRGGAPAWTSPAAGGSRTSGSCGGHEAGGMKKEGGTPAGVSLNLLVISR